MHLKDLTPEQLVFFTEQIGAIVDTFLNGANCPKDKKKIGFYLMLFDTGQLDGTRTTYTTNCNMNDVINLMKESISRLEGMKSPETKTMN